MNILDEQRLVECLGLLNQVVYNNNPDYYCILNKEAQIWKMRFYELIDSIESMREDSKKLYEGYKNVGLNEHALEAEAYYHAFNVMVEHIHKNFNFDMKEEVK